MKQKPDPPPNGLACLLWGYFGLLCASMYCRIMSSMRLDMPGAGFGDLRRLSITLRGGGYSRQYPDA